MINNHGAATAPQTREDVMEKVNEILEEKAKAGSAAYLWLHSLSGDCILWPDEESSIDDDGRNAIERWQLTTEESEILVETGEVDEVA